MDAYLFVYVVLAVAYRGVDILVMFRSTTIAKKPARDWTEWLIMVPYWLVVVAPAVDYLDRDYRNPGVFALVAGGILFALAMAVRARAHVDLRKQFPLFVKEGQERGLVTSGIYAYVRYPLYLANVLYFLACTTFLGVTWPWILTALAIVGIVTRIHSEEHFLRRHFEGYVAYAENTWRLIPWIY
jgi:protein-S-isoprenylcysteine O-methyltransferase Ste14